MNNRRSADQVSINIFDLIDQICVDYRKQWTKVDRPRIEEFLTTVPESNHPTLLRHLLQVEFELRRRSDENPSSAELDLAKSFFNLPSAYRSSPGLALLKDLESVIPRAESWLLDLPPNGDGSNFPGKLRKLDTLFNVRAMIGSLARAM